jgi:hypothetical protein
VKRSRGYEQNVIGLDYAITGAHIGPFHQREQIPLHPLTGDVRAALGVVTGGNLVDFVDEDDAVRLQTFQGRTADLVLVHQFGGFLIAQQRPCFGNAHLAPLRIVRRHTRK